MGEKSRIINRRSIRLEDFDYASENAYFVTICTHDMQCIFGDVIDGKMRLNEFGKMVEREWLETENRFPHVDLDEFVIMPNHVHGIIIVGATLAVARASQTRAGASPAPTHEMMQTVCKSKRPTLGQIVGAFKSLSARKWIKYIEQGNILDKCGKLWQRNFYDHIIRNENDLYHIRGYIFQNPLNWHLDENNPDNLL